MIQVAVITETLAVELASQTYGDGINFYPMQDGLGRWVISLEEMNGLGLDLKVIEWTPPATEGLEHPTPTDLTNES